MTKWKYLPLIMILFCYQGFADEIQLTTGEVIEGQILEENDYEIYFESQNEITNYSLRNLQRINARTLVPEENRSSEKTNARREEDQTQIKPLPQHIVRAAYQAIPHAQTTYSSEVSLVPREEAEKLEKIFILVDRAVVARVETLKYFQTMGEEGKSFVSYKEEIERILKKMEKIKVDDEVEKAKDLIMKALKNQKKYFSEWQKAVDRKKAFPFQLAAGITWQQQKNIQASNQQLIQAYSMLKRKYAHETTRNQQAMFDHLCALDFV